MFSDKSIKCSGKHLVCDIKEIKNEKLLNDFESTKKLLDFIC